MESQICCQHTTQDGTHSNAEVANWKIQLVKDLTQEVITRQSRAGWWDGDRLTGLVEANEASSLGRRGDVLNDSVAYQIYIRHPQ